MRTFNRKGNCWGSTGHEEISGTLTTYLKRKAKERNLDWNLTAEFLWSLYVKQNKKCALTGVPLFFTTKINSQHNLSRNLMNASLDRIDNGRGYEEDNVQWVHKIINKIRRDLTIDEFRNWCCLVYKHEKEQECVS